MTPTRTSGSSLALVLAGVAGLVGAGILLWGRHGAAIFSDAVLTALAFCF